MYDKYSKYGSYHKNWLVSPDWLWYRACVDKIVSFCDGSTIDAGVGDGVLAKRILENGYDVIGLDNEPTGLRLAKENGISVMHWDLNDTHGILDTGFDYLCSLNTIEHLKTTNGIKNLINHNVTKGAIIITDKATEHKGRYHEHEYTKEELLETFAEFKPKYFEINSTEFGKPITFIGVEIRK